MSVKDFVKQWSNIGGEKANAQKFWLTLIRDVLGVDKPENFIQFEVPVQLAHKSFIDGYFPDSKVIVEQKSCGVDLEKEITQSDGSKLTPYEQAKRYGNELQYSLRPRWIITCNFREFLIYDMETLAEPTRITLDELPEKFHALDFLIDVTQNKIRIELELSLQAGEIVAKIYDALLAQYINPNSAASLASLNKLCVRLVFCLYAESSGIFGKHKIFRDYLKGSRNIRRDLLDLFDVLNTPVDKRDPYLDDTLKKFPYVNGGLFDGAIEIPNFTPEIRDLLLDEASSGFNWNGISPTIFGAVFESTLNPDTRRAGGMHYTSTEIIHKAIDPLFLDDLREEFAQIKSRKKLLAFHDKLANIKIFDPACGSGNFLTESYLSLRRLENDLLKELLGSQIQLGELDDPIKVSIANFYGIEINDFAVSVAQTAMWIAELQMMADTAQIVHRNLDALPLKSYANIHKANALLVDWKTLVPPDADFIIGNPPFVGTKYQISKQKSDLAVVDPRLKSLDYVTGWYFKAVDFMKNSNTRAAFVSTNSVAQGEQVGQLWSLLDCHIDFAHRPFIWDSESKDKAHVHCVVVGFSCTPNDKPKRLFLKNAIVVAKNINGYLFDGPNIYAQKRNSPICEVQIMVYGSEPREGGFLLLNEDERAKLLSESPAMEKYIRRFMSSNDFINGKIRYCLWLKDANPHELRQSKIVMQRLKDCAEFRANSKQQSAYAARETPALFASERQPTTDYLLIPIVSGERRRYIPIGYMPPEVIVSNACFTISNATRYTFGVLTSSIHMAWMRVVCGRLGISYRYSNTIVYNNFIWPKVSAAQQRVIELTAQKILDVRKKYPDSTLADLYDPLTMPADLRAAHRANDRAVAAAYGFEAILDDEPAIVAELFKLYAAATGANLSEN